MNVETILPEILRKTESKILLLVLDGLGGLPHPRTGKTELETARKPNLDRMAERGACGLMVPVEPGITPGSGPAHLGLFGYDPIDHQIGRGVLENVGIGVRLEKDDLAIRGNFATVDSGRIVTDRRAGRISTDENRSLVRRIGEKVPDVMGVKVEVRTVKEHRCAVVLRGDRLSPAVGENDPGKEGLALREIAPLAGDGGFTARVLNEFLRRVEEAIAPLGSRANTLLLRGFSKMPSIASFQQKYLLRPACIATYPMYRGLSQLVGMDILQTGETLQDQLQTLRDNRQRYDFFYLHIKKCDAMGEDGNFDGKVKVFEDVDSRIGEIEDLPFDVVVVTGDHSTPAVLKGHSWHPVPFVLISPNAIPDDVRRLTERDCAKGILGTFRSTQAIYLMLAAALKLNKFGA